MSKSASVIETDDPVVRGLLPGYLARRREELASLEALLGVERFGELKHIGHNLAGSGGAYGLPGLTEIGRGIEASAESRDAGALQRHLERLSALLDQVEAELDSPAA